MLTTIAPGQEEQVLEALRCSLDATLAKIGNESRASAIKDEVTTNQLSILLMVYHKAENRKNLTGNSIDICKTFFKEGTQRDDSRS